MQILIPAILFLSIFVFSFLWNYYSYRNNGGLSAALIKLPIFGMIPSILLNLHRILDYTAEGLQKTQGTFIIGGPWFTKLELLVTADPANTDYVMSKNHGVFNRGDSYNEIFEIFGEGLIKSESDKWKYQRKIATSSFKNPNFRQFMAETLQSKMDKGLIPLLERSHNEGRVVDLQEIFHRLATDVIFILLIGTDSNYLSFESLGNHFNMVSSYDVEDALLARHILPEFVWKLQRKLGIGKEKKLSEFTKFLHDLSYEIISKKREEAMVIGDQKEGVEYGRPVDLIGLYIEENYGANHGFESTNVFLRDTFVNFVLAGQDTVSSVLAWLFWLLIKHPQVEAKIKEELIEEEDSVGGCDISQLGNANKLVYLHAAICEALRLYPTVPYIHRAANKHETLPSGHKLKPSTVVILSAYAMGRMKWVWGEDCEEFKPERWITEKGNLKHEPSNKFFSFGTGPRICIGKEIAFIQMKAVARQVLSHDYQFQMVEGHRVKPASSMILRLKHGLKVKVLKNSGSILGN